MKTIYILLAVIVTASLAYVYPALLLVMILLSTVAILFTFFKRDKETFTPQTKTYRSIEKIKRKREKKEKHKHQHINDQIAYIANYWGYTKAQEKVVQRFVEKRAYSEMYNKLTASLFPQVIALIDQCNAKEQKGCKREVSKRIKALTDIMKNELTKTKGQKEEDFDSTLKVYDKLMQDVKH